LIARRFPWPREGKDEVLAVRRAAHV